MPREHNKWERNRYWQLHDTINHSRRKPPKKKTKIRAKLRAQLHKAIYDDTCDIYTPKLRERRRKNYGQHEIVFHQLSTFFVAKVPMNDWRLIFPRIVLRHRPLVKSKDLRLLNSWMQYSVTRTTKYVRQQLYLLYYWNPRDFWSQNMYKVINLTCPVSSSEFDSRCDLTDADIERLINQVCRNGWQLVSLDANNRAVFKRELETCPTQEETLVC